MVRGGAPVMAAAPAMSAQTSPSSSGSPKSCPAGGRWPAVSVTLMDSTCASRSMGPDIVAASSPPVIWPPERARSSPGSADPVLPPDSAASGATGRGRSRRLRGLSSPDSFLECSFKTVPNPLRCQAEPHVPAPTCRELARSRAAAGLFAVMLDDRSYVPGSCWRAWPMSLRRPVEPDHWRDRSAKCSAIAQRRWLSTALQSSTRKHASSFATNCELRAGQRAAVPTRGRRGLRLKLRYRGIIPNDAWLRSRTAALNLRTSPTAASPATTEPGSWPSASKPRGRQAAALAASSPSSPTRSQRARHPADKPQPACASTPTSTSPERPNSAGS